RNLRALLGSDLPVFYEFHAADLLALGEDDVDPRMDRHPGMREPLARKRALLRETLSTITAARRVTTYRAVLEGQTWHGATPSRCSRRWSSPATRNAGSTPA